MTSSLPRERDHKQSVNQEGKKMMTRPFGKPALSRLSGAAIAAAFVCAGCASTGDNLQRETARAIGGNVTPEQVTVTNIDRGATSVKWQATAPGGRYACSADDMVRRVLCTKSR